MFHALVCPKSLNPPTNQNRTYVLFVCKFIYVDVVGGKELIFKHALHALDLLQGLVVALSCGEAGGSKQAQLHVDVTQLPVQIVGFVAVLLHPLLCRHWMHRGAVF